MRNFYLVTTKYLMAHLPINNQLLNDLSAVHPLQRNKDQTALEIRRIAKMLPQIIKKEEIGQLLDDWKVYQSQEIPNHWYLEEDNFSRIDKYWQKVMESRDSSGDIRYRVLSKLLKAILTIVHGNADVERSLSENKKVLTKKHSLMTDASLNAIRMTKLGCSPCGWIWLCGEDAHNIRLNLCS